MSKRPLARKTKSGVEVQRGRHEGPVGPVLPTVAAADARAVGGEDKGKANPGGSPAPQAGECRKAPDLRPSPIITKEPVPRRGNLGAPGGMVCRRKPSGTERHLREKSKGNRDGGLPA